jgi:uncharacterized protein
MWDDFILFVIVGFAAQLVDGALGMAYGVTATTTLLGFGFSPAVASATTHASEIFTTAVSAISHWKLENVRWSLVLKLAIPGMIGGAVGAYVLSEAPGKYVTPVVSVYLLIMGLWILWQAFHVRAEERHGEEPKWTPALGVGGGLMDAIGGGGWGPIINTTLIGLGTKARYSIGSVNASEFFVTVAISLTFLFTIQLELWPAILGLIVGGMMAAPIGAFATKIIPDRYLMILVGVIITLLSVRTLIKTIQTFS